PPCQRPPLRISCLSLHDALPIFPFMGAATMERALDAAHALMAAGANMIKVEGGAWLADTVMQYKRNGIPVCVHMGLTPQFVNALDRKSTRLNSSHVSISYAVFCL